LLAELEVYIGKRIRLQNEPLYIQSKYDVVMM
jgi:ribonuclease G